MRKKLWSVLICISLIISMTAQGIIGGTIITSAGTTCNVATYTELTAAIADTSVSDITLTDDIMVGAQLVINRPLIIDGNGHLLSVPVSGFDASGGVNASPSTFRVFNVSSVDVTIKNMQIKGGSATSGSAICNNSSAILHLNNVVISNSGGSNCTGGGISNSGTIYMDKCNLSRNGANYGGGFLNNSTGKMFIENSTISENRSMAIMGGGGGGENQGLLCINNSTFANNISTEWGGAINSCGGIAYIVNSTFTGNVNYKPEGAAIRVGGQVKLANTLFAYNYSSADNGATYSLNDFTIDSTNGEANYCLTNDNISGKGNESFFIRPDGSNNDLFAGGALTKVLDANGNEKGEGVVFQPFLSKVSSTACPTVQLSRFNQIQAIYGTNVSFSYDSNGTPTIGYFDTMGANTWVSYIGSTSQLATHEIRFDQNGAQRDRLSYGAVATTSDILYMLKINASAGGCVSGGTIYGDVYAANTKVTLTEVPAANNRFVGWQYVKGGEGIASTGSSYTVTVDQNITLLPTYVPKITPTVSVTVSANPPKVGSTMQLNAAISGTYDRTGTVTFYSDAGPIDSPVTILDGERASINYTPTGAGSHFVYAAYSGDKNYKTMTSGPTIITVAKNSSTKLSTPLVTPGGAQAYPVSSLTVSSTLENYIGVQSGKTIEFYNGTTLLGSADTDNSGVASFVWNNPLGGIYQLTAKFAGDVNNVSATSSSLEYTVGKGTQADLAIAGQPSDVTYGDASFTLVPSGGSGTSDTYTYSSSNENSLTINDTGAVTVKNPGTAIITVTKAGDINYNPISNDITIVVGKKTLNAAITPNNKVYDAGTAASVKDVSYEGILNSDDVSITDGIIAFENNNASDDKPVHVTKSYNLSGSKAANYTLGTVTVNTANITKKALQVSVARIFIKCGCAIPALSVMVNASNFIAGENESNLTGFLKPTASQTYGSTISPVSSITMPISFSGGAATNNYYFEYVPSTLLTIQSVTIESNDYQVTGNYCVSAKFSPWNKSKFSIKPANGYDLISTDGTNWVSDVNITNEISNGSVKFKLKKSSDGMQTKFATIYYNLDTTAPIISGITDGETYYVDQTVTVSDANIDTITVNGLAFVNGSKLLADKSETYVITATDKAGNSSTYTVYTKAIDSLDDSIEGITTTNVKLSDEAQIKSVLANVNMILSYPDNGITTNETNELNAIKSNVISLLNRINEKINAFEDATTGTKLSGIDGTTFDYNTKLIVMPIADELDVQTKALYIAGVEKVAKGEKIQMLYDIKLLLNGNPVQPDGNVKITLKLTDDMKNVANLKVVYIDNDGNVTIIPSTKNGDEVTFVTNHFSNYGIIGTPTEQVATGNQVVAGNQIATGDYTPIMAYVIGAIAAILCMFACRKKRNCKRISK